MTEKDFKKICENVLSRLNHKSEYSKLCKDLSDFDNRKSLIKDNALEIIKEFELDFKISGSDKMFYKDYFFGDFQLRFMIPYGHGMVDCAYRVFRGMTDNSIPHFSYRSISECNKRHEDDYIMTFPIITSIEEYKTTLKLILQINEDFIKLFADELSNNQNINN